MSMCVHVSVCIMCQCVCMSVLCVSMCVCVCECIMCVSVCVSVCVCASIRVVIQRCRDLIILSLLIIS